MARTYVITGASSGVGAATTALLRAAGHTVVGLARSGTDVRADLSTTQGRADGAAAAVAAAGGHVDAVITCAAVSGPPRDSVSVNYFGTVDFLTALRPHLAHSPAPRAAAVSSMSVFQPSYPGLVDLLLAGDEPGARRLAEELTSNLATQTMIGSSGKRALSQWVRSEAITSSWAGAGIALNAVAPGVILTPRTNQLLTTPESITFMMPRCRCRSTTTRSPRRSRTSSSGSRLPRTRTAAARHSSATAGRTRWRAARTSTPGRISARVGTTRISPILAASSRGTVQHDKSGVPVKN